MGSIVYGFWLVDFCSGPDRARGKNLRKIFEKSKVMTFWQRSQKWRDFSCFFSVCLVHETSKTLFVDQFVVFCALYKWITMKKCQVIKFFKSQSESFGWKKCCFWLFDANFSVEKSFWLNYFSDWERIKCQLLPGGHIYPPKDSFAAVKSRQLFWKLINIWIISDFSHNIWSYGGCCL